MTPTGDSENETRRLLEGFDLLAKVSGHGEDCGGAPF